MKEKLIGIGVLGALLVVGLFFYLNKDGGGFSVGNATTIHGLVGGEKIGLLSNPEVKSILKNKYGLILDIHKAGSIEMVKKDHSQLDFLWPGNRVALEMFKKRAGKNADFKSEIIFNSPLVLYSWLPVSEALAKSGIVSKKGQSYFITDFPRLVRMIMEGKKWSEIGLTQLYGKISIISTDPTRSGSGNMFAGLLGNVMLGDVVSAESLPGILPRLKLFFKRLGYLHGSSGDLFEQYLRMGVGAKPIVVGYENQIIEFARKHKELWPKIQGRVRILYPVPTVWSSHPLIVIKPEANKLLKAMRDPEIQEIAWKKHGFRTGLIDIQADPDVLHVVGIPPHIEKVMPLPEPRVMKSIIRYIK